MLDIKKKSKKLDNIIYFILHIRLQKKIKNKTKL